MAKLLSAEFYAEMKKLEARYPSRVALLIPALHSAQAEHGWLPGEVMDEVASYLEIHPAQVREVATFYTMFNLKPVGKHHIKLCTNVSCALRGAEALMEHCERRLGISVGETTADRLFTLSDEECLGACGTAPAAMINDDYHENLNPERMDQLFDRLRAAR